MSAQLEDAQARQLFGEATRVERSTTGCPCCAQGVQIKRGGRCLGAGETFAQALASAQAKGGAR